MILGLRNRSRFARAFFPAVPSPAVPTLLTCLLLSAFALAVPTDLSAQGYGYAKLADPLLAGVKTAIAAAREGTNDKVKLALEGLEPFIAEIETGLGVDLGPSVQEARAKGDARILAFELAELVFHQLRFKLENNLTEKLESPLKARRRLETAQIYYEQILSFSVRRSDSKNQRADHEATLKAFTALHDTVGSEGLFGVGGKDPDPKQYRALCSSLIRRLNGVFPQFSPPREGELGVPEPPEKKAEGPKAPSAPSEGSKP